MSVKVDRHLVKEIEKIGRRVEIQSPSPTAGDLLRAGARRTVQARGQWGEGDEACPVRALWLALRDLT
jgi:hypothetical protein